MKKVFFLVCVYFFSFTQVFARGEFQADYDVNYSVSLSGTTIVTQNITLTNNLTNLYPKRYTITIDSDRIKNIIATDERGVIAAELSLKDGKTEIGLPLNTQNVGLGKKTSFTLRYEHADVARKNGQIWEVTIPGVEDDPDLGFYRVTLSVPPSFGTPGYMTPPPVNGSWDKEHMTRGGITIAYGSEQVFELALSYFLQNEGVTEKEAEIALPPETSFQDVVIGLIDPTPNTIVRDSDGNWLARYTLSPRQTLAVEAQLSVTSYLQPRKDFASQLTDPNVYLNPQKYWEIYDAKIQDIAQKYRTPREIYDFVVSTLSYDYQRVSQNPVRLGASAALNNPTSAVCMEFTDLFITIARAAGIPAREVVGYAYTTNSKLRPLSLVSDVLHAWPEYYDSKRDLWVPIDPTWADTTGGVDYFNTLDFNHIVFAIHGLSSEYPYPAGFYRNADKSEKDVNVRFADSVPTRTNTEPVSISIQFPGRIIGGITATGSVVVRNVSEHSIPELLVNIESRIGNVNLTRLEQNIPPYGTITIPVSFKAAAFLADYEGSMVISANESTKTFTFRVTPIYWILVFLPLPVVVVFLIWKFLKR